jgi:CMP-N-acetylneuraminic acid synthetase
VKDKIKYLAIVPARSGSKRIKDKNIKIINGKPLIYYTIKEAKKSKYLKDNIYLSTDSRRIADIGLKYGVKVPFLRRKRFAKDTSPTYELILEYMDYFKRNDIDIKNIILLQPTSPLRTSEDIDNAIKKYERLKASFLVSISPMAEHPYYFYKKKGDFIRPVFNKKYIVKRSQDLEKVYRINGAIYIANAERYLETKSFLTSETIYYEMPRERSIDIDDEFDLKIIECLIRNKVVNGRNVTVDTGSVMTKDIPDDVVAVGNQARIVKSKKNDV